MARGIDLIGEWSKSHSAVHSKLLERLLPDQAGVLRSAESISLDQGIDSVLKDLVERIGPPVRSRLLHTGLAEVANANDLRGFADGLKLIVTKTLVSDALIADAIGHLHKHAPDGGQITSAPLPLPGTATASPA